MLLEIRKLERKTVIWRESSRWKSKIKKQPNKKFTQVRYGCCNFYLLSAYFPSRYSLWLSVCNLEGNKFAQSTFATPLLTCWDCLIVTSFPVFNNCYHFFFLSIWMSLNKNTIQVFICIDHYFVIKKTLRVSLEGQIKTRGSKWWRKKGMKARFHKWIYL